MASKFRKRYTYIDAAGNETSTIIRAENEREADKKFQAIITGAATPRKAAPCLKDFVDTVYRPSFMEGLAPSTKNNYEQYLHYNILPFMGDMSMDTISVATIQQFQNWMANGEAHGRKTDLNEKTITRVCGFAGRIFKVAAEMKVIEDTPFKSTLLKNPGKAAGHHTALPDAEVARIKSEIPLLSPVRERIYMGLLVYTGMRREELLGLRWEDVNLEGQYAIVKRAVTYPDMNKPHIGKPKTERSGRTILLAKPLVEILQPFAKVEGFVLGDEAPLCYSTAKRLQQRAFMHLGIVGYNNHDFRTTLGTQLKEAGMSSANVADIMGHADTRMVETVYARTRHDGVMKQLDALERLNKRQCAPAVLQIG